MEWHRWKSSFLVQSSSLVECKHQQSKPTVHRIFWIDTKTEWRSFALYSLCKGWVSHRSPTVGCLLVLSKEGEIYNNWFHAITFDSSILWTQGQRSQAAFWFFRDISLAYLLVHARCQVWQNAARLCWPCVLKIQREMNYWTFSPCICLIKDPPNQLWNEDKVARLVSGQNNVWNWLKQLRIFRPPVRSWVLQYDRKSAPTCVGTKSLFTLFFLERGPSLKVPSLINA